MDPKDAAMQLLMQETYTRSECDALIKIIQERVVDSDPGVDEPAVVLPIAWQDSTQEHPVAYSSFSPKTSPATSGIPAYSPVFDNIDEKRWLKENSTNVEGHCSLKSLKHDMSHPIGKRSYSNTGETFEESRRVRRKLNRSNISEKPVDVLRNRAASFDSPSTNDTSALRGFPKEFTNIPLLGTENLTFSDMASKAETSSDTAMFHDKPCAIPVQQLVSTSCQADWDKRDSTMSYPFSNLDPMETFPVKVEPLDELAPLEPDMTYLAQKNDTRTMCDDSCSVSKLMFQEDVEAAPSSSMGLQVENSSRNCTKALNVQRSVPTKTRSPANSNRRPNNRNAVKLWNGLPQQSNPAPVGQEPDAGQIHAKRSVGRPRKARR
uniref:Uncharacterized protein n=1 Tax=Arundo donax TaxID=35708 RepID=A0A0A9HPQ4_ARUDO